MNRGKTSFFEWCKNTNNDGILDRWDYELNGVNPENISYGSAKKCYFKCCDIHNYTKLIKLNNITGQECYTFKCDICNSFYNWCLENNHQDYLDLWDYDLNDKKPNEIDYASNKKYYFKCKRGIHDSSLHEIYKISLGSDNIFCRKCNSIGQKLIDNFGIDNFEKMWDYNKNLDSPFELQRGSHKKIALKCANHEHHGIYYVSCTNIKDSMGCPYCGMKKVHPQDSVGTIYKDKVSELFSKKNTINPLNLSSGSNKRIILKCNNGIHEDYSIECVNAIKRGFNCPKCAQERKESVLQTKVREYINTFGYSVNHENKCSLRVLNPSTGRYLIFDNEIVELKLLIEVHGEQHYKLSTWHKLESKRYNKTPQQCFLYQKAKDRYKKYIANKRGYNVLEIPYWTDNETEDWKLLIENYILNNYNIELRNKIHIK